MIVLTTFILLIIYDTYTTRYRTWQIGVTIALVYTLTGGGCLFVLWLFNEVTIPQ